ncbi:hypothetical protein BD770DRAFT_387166 [Pilaira anomala]|nr:hypothetical protein BD770DRAFT_387166 [Pilaira anomala]
MYFFSCFFFFIHLNNLLYSPLLGRKLAREQYLFKRSCGPCNFQMEFFYFFHVFIAKSIHFSFNHVLCSGLE